ncbi:oxidoreductase [Jatrophihabitans fulvus]
MGWTADALPDLGGRTAVVTGANSGIGFNAARELAAHGATVVLAGRDAERTAQAASRIEGKVEAAALDLASSASVRSFADAWNRPLDLLINNAGVMAPPRRATTEDGYELQFGVNHLGHYVLTGLLLPALRRAPSARVVTVASLAHFGGTADVLDGNAAGPYDGMTAYRNSKLANVLFARQLHRELAARGSSVTSTAAHPGVSATNLFTSRQGMGAKRVVRALAPLVLSIATQSSEAGARATLYAAVEAEPGSYTGPQRFGETRGPVGPARLSSLAQDDDLARRLWTVSEELTGLRYPW